VPRNPSVKLPKQNDVPVPPSQPEWLTIRDDITRRLRLLLRFVECEAVRISGALTLTYGNVDFDGGRVLVRETKTKAGTRWLPCPPSCSRRWTSSWRGRTGTVTGSCSPASRTGRCAGTMYRACLDAGIVAYSPHDLRDRRISLWIAQGVDAVQAAAWSGHSKASMTLDVYAHVAIDPAADEWRDFWLGAYRDRAAHVVPMWSDEDARH
jgi:integrase